MIHGMIIKNIIKKLRIILADNYDDFIMKIEKHKIRISGSFIIQCALDEYWQYSDIDLYTYATIPINFFNWATGRYLYHRVKYNELPNIKNIINFNKRVPGITVSNNSRTHELQMIILERSAKNPTISSYINNTYDFNICKNIYKIKNGKHQLKINNLSSIMNKEIQIDINNMGKNTATRCKKYMARGFEIRKEKHDHYIRYMNRIIPIIYCNVQDENMSNIYFMGKHMKTSKWRNKNITIKHFSRDMYSNAYICHRSGLAHSYDKNNNILVQTGSYHSILRCCPVDDYYDIELYEHRHTTMIMRKKNTGKEYLCDIIIIKCKHPNTKNNYESANNYEWLDILYKSDHQFYRDARLIDNRDLS